MAQLFDALFPCYDVGTIRTTRSDKDKNMHGVRRVCPDRDSRMDFKKTSRTEPRVIPPRIGLVLKKATNPNPTNVNATNPKILHKYQKQPIVIPARSITGQRKEPARSATGHRFASSRTSATQEQPIQDSHDCTMSFANTRPPPPLPLPPPPPPPPPLPPLHRMENGMVDSDKPWVHEQRRDAYPMWCWMTEEEKNTAPIPEDTAPHHYSKYWRKYGDCQQCIKCRVLCFV